MILICNADDFGHSKGVNLGIVEAYQNGIVRSTTIMAGMPGFDHAVNLAKENQGLKIGVHLTLSAGKTVGGIYSTISDREGNFLKLAEVERRAYAGQLDLAEVEREYEAQIQKVTETGIQFDHFDSHHHTHELPGVIDVFLKLAKKYDVAVRVHDKGILTDEFAGIKSTNNFIYTFYGEQATVEELKRICQAHSEDTVELMCHPAYLDVALSRSSSYSVNRTVELYVLTSDEVKAYVEENRIKLSSFSDL